MKKLHFEREKYSELNQEIELTMLKRKIIYCAFGNFETTHEIVFQEITIDCWVKRIDALIYTKISENMILNLHLFLMKILI